MHLMQIGRIAFLEPAVGQAELPGPPVPGLNQIARDINAKHLRPEFCRGYCRRAIATAKVQNFEAFCYANALDERLSALSHALGNARKVAFFPECFVWIHGDIHGGVVGSFAGLLRSSK
jgi:hypothetical protein